MSVKKTPIALQGTTQDNRFLNALDFDYAKIDERTFEDLLVFSWGMSKLVKFYGVDDKPNGDWSSIMVNEIVVLALIIKSDPSKVETRFQENLHKAGVYVEPQKKLNYLRLCFQEIYQMAVQFETWMRMLKKVEEFSHSPTAIKNELSSAIYTKLNKALASLKSYDEGAGEENGIGERIGLDYTYFQNFQNMSNVVPSTDAYVGKTLMDKVDNALNNLQKVFHTFYETLLYLKGKSPDYLNQALKKNTHYPESALFISFLRLFEILQQNLNQFTQRHLDFYYAQNLHQQPKPAAKDQVFLKFVLDDLAPLATVKKDTKFLAGEDSQGNDIIYTTDSQLQVNQIEIRKLHSIFIKKQDLNVSGVDKHLINHILSCELPVQDIVNVSEPSIPRTTYALFGEDQTEKGTFEKTMKEAQIGFAISSPSLILSEGNREITITFQFTESSFSHLDQFLEDISQTTDSPVNEVFIKSFLEAFYIHVTISDGWYEIDRYVVNYHKDEQHGEYMLKIRFDMGISEPAIVGYDEDIHKGAYNTDLPLVKFVLNSDSYIYPFSLKRYLVLQEITFHTKVEDVKNLLIYNPLSQLSPDSPYMPFGPLPSLGAYFIIGSNEIFQKSLEDLAINIEWFDPPRHEGGFFGHYREYGLEMDNTVFEAKVSILDGGAWKPTNANERQTIKLFRTVNGGVEQDPKPRSAILDRTRIANIDIDKIKQPPNYQALSSELNYSNVSQRGFLRLELSGPQFSFGHDIYPALVSTIAMGNSKLSLFKKKKQEMPKEPYAPQIKSTSLDYVSSSTIIFRGGTQEKEESESRGQFYHIHPFGERMVWPDFSQQITRILPDYEYEGCLQIGLSNIHPPQTITLLFELLDEYTLSSEEEPPRVEWHYLTNDSWIYLEPSKILQDTTGSFIKTGIIEIELPMDMKDGNSILDPDLYWLRVSVVDNIEEASRLMSISTHVLKASLQSNNELTDDSEQTLPPFSINRSLNNIEGIQSVVQPITSFNGSLEEKPKKFYTRVAERLKHKKRAVTAWDYERLILENFPDVYQVTCFPNITSRNPDAPGSVMLVITQRRDKAPNPVEPMASNEVLYEIKAFLQNYTSPFVNFEVRNPNFERVKIICSVKFTPGYSSGFYLQELSNQIIHFIAGDSNTNQRLDLGGRIHISDVMSFMRTFPYIDFITEFSMLQTAINVRGSHVLIDTAHQGIEKDFLLASKPFSVLVPAINHQFNVLDERKDIVPDQSGFSDLEIGSDFIIE